MANVFRDKKYAAIYERLVENETGYGQKIFANYKELMIFAAMVGFYNDQKESEMDKSFEIPQRIFESDQKDSYIYLCAVHDKKDGEIFREKNNLECWSVFQAYANGGLEIINNWLIESPGDIDGVDTILNQIKIVAADFNESSEEPSNLDAIVW